MILLLSRFFHIAQFNRGINSFSDMTKGPGCALMGVTKSLVVLIKQKWKKKFFFLFQVYFYEAKIYIPLSPGKYLFINIFFLQHSLTLLLHMNMHFAFILLLALV